MGCWSFMTTEGMGWMMWMSGLSWLLVIALPGLAAAALVKYLFSARRRLPDPG